MPDRPGPHGVALETGQLLCEALVVQATGRENVHAALPATRMLDDLSDRGVDVLHRHSRGLLMLGGRGEEDERPASHRIGSGEQHGHEGPVVQPHDGGLG